MRLRQLLVLLSLLATAVTVSAKASRLSNAERLARGLLPKAPRRLFDPSRVDTAKRATPSYDPGTTTTGVVGAVSLGQYTPPPPSVGPAPPKRTITEPPAQGPLFSFWLERQGNPQSGPYAATSSTNAVSLQYVQPDDESDLVNIYTAGSSSVYLSLCSSSTNSWISDDSGTYIGFLWSSTSYAAGAFGESENCVEIQTDLFTVDDSTGEVTVNWVNNQNPNNYPPEYPLPKEYPTATVFEWNSAFWVTGNFDMTGAQLVANWPTIAAPIEVVFYVDV